MPTEKQAGVQRCGTWESSRDNCHLISHHQKLLHKIIVNYGGLLCIWFPTAATAAVTFLKIKCTFHWLTGREKRKKIKKEKMLMENLLKALVPYMEPHAVSWLYSGTSRRDTWCSGTRQDRLRQQKEARADLSELRPAAARCLFNWHSLQLTCISHLQQGTLHKADYCSSSPPKQAAALKALAIARSCAMV